MTTSSTTVPQETRIVEMVFPNQTNHHGTLFGGDALRLMDMPAFVTAPRHARHPVVTASSERIDFVPVREGQLAEVVGRVGAIQHVCHIHLGVPAVILGNG